MPHVLFEPDAADLAGGARADSYHEVASQLGYGLLVVDAARAAELEAIAGGLDQVNTITAHATTPATAGTWTMTVNGQTTSALARNIDDAALQTALEALSSVGSGNVVCAMVSGANLGVAAAKVSATFQGDLAGAPVTVTANMAGLTGNAHVLARTVKGGAWIDRS